jgi:hypothetical protein
MNWIVALSPLIGQIENITATEAIGKIALVVSGTMGFWILKGIDDKITKVIEKLSGLETRIAVVETRVDHLEEDTDQ